MPPLAVKEGKASSLPMKMGPPVEGPRRTRRSRKARQFQREDFDDNLVAAMQRKRPRGPPDGGIFDKMLEEPCPYHKGGANHKLKDCRMLKKHFDGLGFKKDARDDRKKEKGVEGISKGSVEGISKGYPN